MIIVLKQTFLALLIFLLVVAASITAFADKMDISTHSALISKLVDILTVTEDGVSKQKITIRLADLYSERARLYSMEQEGKGDLVFKKEIDSDRSTAIKLYEEAFKKARGDTKGAILLQRAHLHQMLGQTKQSKSLFDNVIKDKSKYDAVLVAQAHLEAGDYEFYNQNFSKALSHYENVVASGATNTKIQRLGYAHYRIAWCKYYQGQTEQAVQILIATLKNPNLLKKMNGSHDTAFHEEVARDLATFMSKRDLRSNDIQIISELTPSNVKNANLIYLATELDRTGKKNSALQVWAIVGKQDMSDEDKVDSQVKIARLQYDLNKKALTVTELKKACLMLKEADCDDDKVRCDANKQSIRKLVTDWGQAEERNPSAELIEAYKAYVTHFPDIEINYWAGIASLKRKQWNEAFLFYKNSSELSFEAIDNSAKKSNATSISKIFEGSLLGTIVAAEQSKNLELRDQAYQQYLSLNPNSPKASEVEYQVAQVLLEKGQNDKAAQKFREIAISKKPTPDNIRNQSADLALDTLVVLKDDDRLEKWALEFADRLPSRKKEFLTIVRKLAINQAALAVNTSQSRSVLESKFDKLNKLDLRTATPEEKINFHKHRILLATKMNDLGAIIFSSQALLKDKNASKKDKNDALLQLTWAYETKFDFKNAFQAYKKVTPSRGEEDEHVLKLGLLAELAKQNPTPYYKRFLQISDSKSKKQEVAYNLVRLASNKVKAFREYKKHIAGNTKFYINAGLFAFEETPSASLMKELLSQRGAYNTFEGQLLARSEFIQIIQRESKSLTSHKLKASNQNALARTIKERVKFISQFEKVTQRAIDNKDFTTQFISLTVLAKENKRLAQDILKLPAPKGLTKNNLAQYKKLVEEQVEPYLEKSNALDKKLNELWNHKSESSFAEVLELSNQPKAPGYKTAQRELAVVAQTAKALNLSTSDLTKIRQQRQKLSQDLSSLQSKAQKNPFDSNTLEEMREVVSKLNPGPMVAYLDSRLNELKTVEHKSTGGRN